jgi:MYXO-CTERM domain-containing protein
MGGCGCRLDATSELGSGLPIAALTATMVLGRRRRRGLRIERR